MQNFFYTIYEFLIHTPWYVYIIFIYILFIGIKSLRDNVVSVYKFAILPILFIWMSVDIFTAKDHLSTQHWITFVIGIIIGSAFSWVTFKSTILGADAKKKLVKLSGNYSTLILLLVIFAVKYYVAYQVAVISHPSNMHLIGLILLSSIFTGTFVGRFLLVIYALKHGRQMTLEET